MKHYFEYYLTWCGLPEVTLLGIVRDWELIKQKSELLIKYNLDQNNYMKNETKCYYLY